MTQTLERRNHTGEEKYILLRIPQSNEIAFTDVSPQIRVPTGLEQYVQDFMEPSIAIMKSVLRHGIPKTTVLVNQVFTPKFIDSCGSKKIIRQQLEAFGNTYRQDGSVHIYLPIQQTDETTIRGMKNTFHDVLKNNDSALIDFVTIATQLPKQYFPFRGDIDPAVMLSFIISGESEQLPQYFTYGRAQQVRLQHLFAPWLQTYVRPVEKERQFFTLITTHEFSHSELQSRAVEEGVFKSRNELELLASILNRYDQRIKIHVTNKELLEIRRMQKEDPVGHHRYLNTLLQSSLPYYVAPLEMHEELIKYAVFHGCDEAIATLVSQTLSLLGNQYFKPMGMFTQYSPLSYIFPPLEIISKWEEHLLVEPEEIGTQLEHIYEELLNDGLFAKLFTQAKRKYIKSKVQ